jgi:hypothetical protein
MVAVLPLTVSALTIQENESYSLSVANAISGDGSTVIGNYLNADIGDNFDSGSIYSGLFKWTSQDGRLNLGSLNNGEFDIDASPSNVEKK